MAWLGFSLKPFFFVSHCLLAKDFWSRLVNIIVFSEILNTVGRLVETMTRYVYTPVYGYRKCVNLLAATKMTNEQFHSRSNETPYSTATHFVQNLSNLHLKIPWHVNRGHSCLLQGNS